jgi:hypothetical protein
MKESAGVFKMPVLNSAVEDLAADNDQAESGRRIFHDGFTSSKASLS